MRILKCRRSLVEPDRALSKTDTRVGHVSNRAFIVPCQPDPRS